MVQQSNKSCVIILHYRVRVIGSLPNAVPTWLLVSYLSSLPSPLLLIFDPKWSRLCFVRQDPHSLVLTLTLTLQRHTNIHLTPAHTNMHHWPMSFDREFGSWRCSLSPTQRRAGIPCQQIMYLFPAPGPVVIYNNMRIIWKKDNTLCPLLLSRW